MSIGKRLKTFRMREKNTLEEQGALFGVSGNSIYRWEHDLNTPRRQILVIMADYYKVPVEWLLYGNSAGKKRGKSEYTVVLPPPAINVELQLLRMYRKLSDLKKYKVLGYVERICVEDMDVTPSDL